MVPVVDAEAEVRAWPVAAFPAAGDYSEKGPQSPELSGSGWAEGDLVQDDCPVDSALPAG